MEKKQEEGSDDGEELPGSSACCCPPTRAVLGYVHRLKTSRQRRWVSLGQPRCAPEEAHHPSSSACPSSCSSASSCYSSPSPSPSASSSPLSQEEEDEEEAEAKEKEVVVGDNVQPAATPICVYCKKEGHPSWRCGSGQGGVVKEGWSPPKSPFGLLQETFWQNPWKMLVTCMCLNVTHGQRQVRPVIFRLFERWPTPSAMCVASHAEMVGMLRPLGLANKRAAAIRYVSLAYYHAEWTTPKDIKYLGKYADDSFRMFVLGEWQEIRPTDKKLTMYRDWMFQQMAKKKPEDEEDEEESCEAEKEEEEEEEEEEEAQESGRGDEEEIEGRVEQPLESPTRKRKLMFNVIVLVKRFRCKKLLNRSDEEDYEEEEEAETEGEEEETAEYEGKENGDEQDSEGEV